MPSEVIRIYENAPGLVDALLAHEEDVRKLLTGAQGFRSWGLVRTANGAFTATVCDTAAGCAETVRLAAGWIRDNLGSQNIAAPRLLEGDILHTFQAEGQPPANPHVALVVFPAPPPQIVKDSADKIRELVSSVPGYRLWSAAPTNDGQRGFVVMVADNKSGTDQMMQRMVEFNQQPEIQQVLQGRQPEIIEGEGVKLIRA